MDFENFDEELYNPRQTTLNRYLKPFGVLLAATFLLPIDRGPVNVWDRFGLDSLLTLSRLVLPAVVGLIFMWMAWLSRFKLKQKSALAAALLMGLLFVGVNPFEVLRIAYPPIDEKLGYQYFDMVDGQYFPREDLTHLILLGLGLIGLGVGGRYRATLQSSPLGGYIMMGASGVIAAYYLLPYGGQIPILRNLELYQQFGEFAGEPEVPGAASFAGQLRISAMYFTGVYFSPLFLVLLGMGAWGRARYKDQRVSFAKLAGWGASLYLLAFLLPMLFKEAMRTKGFGFMANLRSYILLAAILVGLTITLSMALQTLLEPKRSDESLPDSPLAWRDRKRR